MLNNRKITRRSFLKAGLFTAFGFAGAMSFGGYYAFAHEPFNWQSRTIELSWPDLPDELDGLKIAHFSDTHFGYHYDQHHFAEVMRKIDGYKADLIVFTGDWFHPDCRDKRSVVNMFAKLKAPLGQYAVLGNHDYFFGIDLISTYLKNAHFELLKNEHRKLSRNGVTFQLAGIDDQTYGQPDLQRTLNTSIPSHFTILLSHTPDFADIARFHPVHLQLSGHSHGGQLRIPGIGPIFGPMHGRKYVDGVYTWADSNMKLFTNRGLGTSRVPLRTFCPPEINLIVVRKANNREATS
jgi:predicted MPP superfamily phosphohydrolase